MIRNLYGLLVGVAIVAALVWAGFAILSWLADANGLATLIFVAILVAIGMGMSKMAGEKGDNQ